MALVRVYCGLASADRTERPAQAGTLLAAAVVDDAGRLLDVREISDDPVGYAKLCTVLAERSGGPTAVAIAADSDDHQVTMLLTAAGRALAVADDDAVDDYAERFADDESTDEMQSPPAERRAVGLARALQAGALSAVSMPAPRDLAGLKGVLVAHAALTTGRHSAAVALREVLRELHPAALRAYPDPAEAVPLAVLDALPEPYSLSGSALRSRDAAAAEAIVGELAGTGVADTATVADAITALRVAIAETPRRGSVSNKALSSAIAQTIRQAVAAVRACDAACDALVTTLTERITEPVGRARPARRAATPATGPAGAAGGAPLHSAPAAAAAPSRHGEAAGALPPRARGRAQPATAGPLPPAPQPLTAPPVAPAPVGPPPVAPAPVTPAVVQVPVPVSPPPAAAPRGVPTPPVQPMAPAAAAAPYLPPAAPVPMTAPAVQPSAPPTLATAVASGPVPAAGPVGGPALVVPPSAPPAPMPSWVGGTSGNRPVSAPPPPPPGITPIVPSQRAQVAPADAGQPFRPTLTTAAINSARAARASAEARAGSAQPAPPAPPAAAHRAEEPPAGKAPERATPEPARQAPPRAGQGPPRLGSEPVVRPLPQVSDPLPDLERPSPARYSATDYAVPVPTPRPDPPAPGSRANWPLLGPGDDSAAKLPGSPASAGSLDSGPDPALNRAGRVTPPWQADDLPPEPPMLRLVEPPPLADRALRGDDLSTGDLATGDLAGRESTNGDRALDPPPLRLVEPAAERAGSPWSSPRDGTGVGRRTVPRRGPDRPMPALVSSEEGDGDLLIFAEAKSAWFIGHGEDHPDWASMADLGWRAAEQAARPAVGAETPAGLPKRVPQANLVPGSPLSAPERPLRITRDAANIAAHTSSYFKGWRRGQESNGYAVGGRPGRESARGWDFAREPLDRDEEEDYGYRSAGHS